MKWGDPYAVGSALILFLLFALNRERLTDALWLLDAANLAFHEAGHPIFGLLGIRFVMVLGGTLMQLLMPTAAIVHFLRRGERISAWAATIWFGQNFLGIGRYMADARAQQLSLIGSGEHDWTTLFDILGVLRHDVGIGAATQLAGCATMAIAISAAWLEFRRMRAARDD